MLGLVGFVGSSGNGGRGGQALARVVESGEATRGVRRVNGVCLEVAKVTVAGSVAVSGCVSGKVAGGGMDAVAGSYLAWQLAGGCSGVRGWKVSVVRATERMEAVSQRWQWPYNSQYVGRTRPTLDTANASVQQV